MGAVVLVVLLPSTREALYGFAFGFQGYRLGPEGAEILAWDGSETAVRVLVRALNTLDPEADAARADAFLAAAGQLAGRPFDRGADWPATTAEVNRWAAERLGRPLDPGGGVWSWFPPSGRVGNWIDDIAASEPDWSLQLERIPSSASHSTLKLRDELRSGLTHGAIALAAVTLANPPLKYPTR